MASFVLSRIGSAPGTSAVSHRRPLVTHVPFHSGCPFSHHLRRRDPVACAAEADDVISRFGDDDAPASSIASIVSPAALLIRAKKLRGADIKGKLSRLGVSYADCFDKDDLAKRLAQAWHTSASTAVSFPLRQIASQPGNPRAGYVLVTLDFEDAGFVDFLIDTGATVALVSPSLRDALGSSATEGAAVRGLGAMGETIRQKIKIPNVTLGSKSLDGFEAVVTDLTKSGLPSTVGGLLGLEFLARFEVEFDFLNRELRFWPRGSVLSGALDVGGLIGVELIRHPVGIKTVSVRLNDSTAFPAIVDMGSAFSVVNWSASHAAGVFIDSPGVKPAAMQAVGVDGRGLNVSLAPFDLEVPAAMDSASGAEALRSVYKYVLHDAMRTPQSDFL